MFKTKCFCSYNFLFNKTFNLVNSLKLTFKKFINFF